MNTIEELFDLDKLPDEDDFYYFKTEMNFNDRLIDGVCRGDFTAIQEAKKLGADDFNCALLFAAESDNNLFIINQLKEWGANNYADGWKIATEFDQLLTKELLEKWIKLENKND